MVLYQNWVMISNNSSSKLKASKSTRDLDLEAGPDSEANQPGRATWRPRSDINSTDNRVHSTVIFSPKDGRSKPRSRPPNEFRAFRGQPGERRGIGRRGGGYASKSERDLSENSMRRFQEPLSKHSSGDSNSNSHYTYSISKYDTDSKSTYIYGLPEDPRISKLLRRLCSEMDVEKSLVICSKLQEAIMLPDNVKYIRRSYDILAESLLDVLYHAPSPETKIQVAASIGRIGFVMGPDYRKHLEWVMDRYGAQRIQDVKTMLIQSFCDLFKLDSDKPSFGEYAGITMTQLQSVIEATDSAKIFIAAVDAILILSKSYPDAFAKHFIDMVDILVGWHVDAAQPKKVKEFALKTLDELSYHWRADLVFSVNLLGQFLEDMVAYGEDLSQPSSARSSPQDSPPPTSQECIQRITSFINVFNTVAKSLGDLLSPNCTTTITWAFLTESFTKMLKTFLRALKIEFNYDLIIAGNQCSFLFLDCLQTKVSSNWSLLYEVIDMELTNCPKMGDDVVLTMLNLIRKAIKEVSANLPVEFIKTVIGPESNLLFLRTSHNKTIKETVVSVYHHLLNLKNIPLLQDAYRYVLEDLDIAYRLFNPEVEILSRINSTNKNVYNRTEAELITLFNLQCLTDLANASNSIIGMWALQPSILELLAVKLKPYDQKLSKSTPVIQYSVVYLLYSHCKNNNHFIASSDLVTFGQQRSNMCDILGIPNINLGEVSNTSPTSGHFGIILILFNNLFKCSLPIDTVILILKWTEDIFMQLKKYLPIIYHSNLLTELIMNIINTGFSFNERVVDGVASNMYILISNRNIPWNNRIMLRLGELSLIHLDSNNIALRRKYSDILSFIPWDIVILDLVNSSDVKIDKYKSCKTLQLNRMNIISTQKEHLMRDLCGQMSPQQFKTFMGYLLYAFTYNEGWLNDSFLNCWPLKSADCADSHVIFFSQFAQNFTSVLTMWATWQAAQLCITLKLRTPLGKPQETFTSIESAIKQIARELTSHDIPVCDNENVNTNKTFMAELKRSRILIEFLEYLEKAIHNAADGCATVMLPVIKSVRTFFHTNSSTCREWVSRVRPAALIVALHAGHSAAVVRHAHSLLLTLSSCNMTPSTILSADTLGYCISLAKAFLQLKEPEGLLGIYTWVKITYHVKLPWLKAAADQASMKYESALANYKILIENDHMLKESAIIETESLRKLDERERKFIRHQITECYNNIQCWRELLKWKDEERLYFDKTEDSAVDNLNDTECYKKFQDDELIYLEDLCDWDILTRYDDKPKQQWSCFDIHTNTEATLKNIALKVMFNPGYLDNSIQNIEESIDILQSNLHELSRNKPCEFITDTNILHFAAIGLKQLIVDRKEQVNPFITSPDRSSLKNVDPATLNKVLWWSDYFSKLSLPKNDSLHLETIRLDLVKSSRKHGNFDLSKRELIKYFAIVKCFQNFSGISIDRLEDVYDFLVRSTSSFDMNIWSLSNVMAIMETSKLLYVNEDTREMSINLCASASLGVSQRLTLGEHTYEFREKGTRMLLTLSKWVQNENDKLLINNLNSPLTKLVTALPEIGLVNNNVSANVIPISDSAVGKLLQFSVNQCPGLSKAWFTFGSWCFRWGRKMVEYSSNIGGQLTENDRLQIQSVMIHGSSEDFNTVCEILSKTRVTCDDEDIDWNEINTSEMIESQLRSVPSLRNSYTEHLILLVDIWRQAQKRVFSYYELSADAYFKFLDLSSASENINHNGECAIVTATLRLLRLIVKHAMELQNVLESGLANTPTQPWKVIIPQLFSRLNHPENYVRRRVSELLCRLAEDTPHLITFPAVVGAVENEKINFADISFPKSIFLENDRNEIESSDAVDNSDNESEKDNDLNSCFMDMVDTLSKQAPKTILQVQLLVKELRRINLLWDELWLGTLAQHHSEITRRLAQLDMEILKVKNNVNLVSDEKDRLIAEKHRIILKPILFVLEQLSEITSAAPETPHEQAFQDKFLEAINEVLDKLRNPLEPHKPQESWLPIKILQSKLQQKSNKRSSYALKMSDISPTLAKMTDTVISMPGVQSCYNIRITIMSIDNNVAILPTKTRPKKLIFHGSDGKTYTYLFKGLEDLHLDERIMQFLSITNTMMAHDKEDSSNQTYRARHYSVIPLGPRSGLISWVDNLTPLFALYKRWQQREAVTLSIKNNKSVTVLRPSELFYNKLTPLLNSAGVSTENRKEWPANILKQVLVELMAETPKDLLAKELWCGSVTPGLWWQTVRRYSFSVAVMSTIGYIIGLGDRHLDNVLVDLSTGELVHIDYNVCFEKGKTLRVPEKVPFRMTPNLERALGVTGVEGIFRLACEHALKTAKRGRETLLTLLEAFVYDPLVEWGDGGGVCGVGVGTSGAPVVGVAAVAAAHAAGGAGARGKRAILERKCAIDMLIVRVAEARHAWQENKEDMLKELPEVTRITANWLDQLRALKVAEGHLQHDHRKMALVKELEALGSDLKDHALYVAAQRYTAYKQMRDALEDSAKGLREMHEDCGNKIENYIRAIETIKTPQLSQWIQELNFPIDHDGHLVFDLIRDFLLNAGQSSMITHCEQSEAELGQCASQQTLLTKTALELLSQYSAVVQYYPQSSMEKHRTALYRKWTEILLNTDSPDICRDVMTQVQSFLSPDYIHSSSVQQAIAVSYQLQSIHSEANIKLNKLYEKLQAEGGQEALPRCKNNYLDAKTTVSNFIAQQKGADKAMECVIVTALCSLNRRYLRLESGAQSAGESLVDLTSRDGEWFLDDMNIISSLIVEFIAYIPSHHNGSVLNDDRINVALDCLKVSKSIFSDIQELSYNFQTIILPEAAKKIQAEDPSVLQMINELNSVVRNTACPLSELLAQMELHLRYMIMDIDSPSVNAQLITADLRIRYEALVSGMLEPSSAGKMLLMGSDGLFVPLVARGTTLLDVLPTLSVPHIWKKVDQIREAMDLAAPLQNEQLRSILEDIILIKRIQALNEFFNHCVEMSCAFKGVNTVAVHDDERLYKPIKRFMADYIGRQFLGVQSQCLSITICLLMQRLGLNVNMEIEQRDIGASWKVPLEELCEITISSSVKTGMFSPSSLQQANALSANLDAAFRRWDTIKTLERSLHIQSASATRLQLQGTAHAWMRNCCRGGPANLPSSTANPPGPPSAELIRVAAQLAALRPRLDRALEKHRGLVASAEQRLKWASGANPALTSVMAAFECAVNIRVDRLTVECSLAASVGKTCAALGVIGSGFSPAQQSRADLPTLASRRRSALALAARAPSAPQPLHEALLQLLRPEGNIDVLWVNNVSALLSDMISQLQKRITELKKNLVGAEEILRSAAGKVANLKSVHEKLISDAKGLLKSISKTQEGTAVKVHDFLAKHGIYIDELTALSDGLNAETLAEDEVSMCTQLANKLESNTPSIYAELISFEGAWQTDESSVNKRRGTLVRQAAGVWNSPARQTTPPKNGGGQQQNAYAASVWKRVRLKLEGRDPDSARKHSNQEQVEYIINEAMSLDNLCLLYEGWTPWV